MAAPQRVPDPAKLPPCPPHVYGERISYAEFCRREELAEFKHEYNDGYAIPIQGPAAEVIGMAGGHPSHSLVAANVSRRFGNALDGSGCKVFQSDLRVFVRAVNRGFYPDVPVVCGDLEYLNPDRPDQGIVNPQIIVEVLSPSTEGHDRGEKHFCYIQIPTLREYVLVSPGRFFVECFSRGSIDETFKPTVAEGEDATLVIPSRKLELPIADFYAGVDDIG